jgi:hypothetical protein
MRELNADAVYTGMVWMREFSEEEGCVEYIERLVSNMEREASCNGTPDCFEMTFNIPMNFWTGYMLVNRKALRKVWQWRTALYLARPAILTSFIPTSARP